MKRADVQSIEDLCVLMDSEAKKWGREDHESNAVNRKGIMEQWKNKDNRKHLDMPMCVYAMIHVHREPMERADGTKSTAGVFEICGLWFNDDDTRAERPAAQLDALKADWTEEELAVHHGKAIGTDK